MSVERLASRLKQVPGTFSRQLVCGIRGEKLYARDNNR